MKFITAILALYIILLSGMPCVDGEALGFDKNELAEKSIKHPNSDGDACSPFCICSCCGVQTLNFTQPIAYTFLTLLPSAIHNQASTYKSIAVSSYYGSIWQPPQIV